MIKIKEKKPSTKKITPYYKLVYNYMIGDANGNTSEEIKVSVENPFIERYVTLLNKLKPLKGHWGVVFRENDLYKYMEEKQITKEDYDFLNRLMFEEYELEEDNTFIVEKKDEKFSDGFFYGVRGETEWSFLVFEGIDLFYYDENGVKHKTYFAKK
jgi:hypothetical protein